MDSHMLHELRPFALLVDRHSSRDVCFTNNGPRFGIMNRYDPTNVSDVANKSILGLLDFQGIDGVFVSQSDKVVHLIRDTFYRFLIYHGRIEEDGATTRALLVRSGVLVVLLFNESQLDDPLFASAFENEGVYKYLEPGIYSTEEGLLAAIKPACIPGIGSFLKRRLQTTV